MLKRPLVRKPMGHPLGLNPAGVLLFRNRALGVLEVFLQPNPRCCSGPRPKLPPHSTPIHPSIHPSLFAFSWFEGAETAPGPQTTWPPLGRESCWGSAVSEPCPRRCFRSRIHGAAQGRYIKRSTAKASTSFHPHPSIHSIHPHPPPSIHPSIHPSISLLLAGSKVLKRPLVRKPMGHPLGLNPAGVLLFRNRALGGVSAADSTVLLRATAKASTPFHPHPSIHPSLFAFSWFEGAETAPGPQTNGPPLGPESCWDSAVSQPCPRRCFCSRIQGAAQGHGQSFHPIPYPSIHPSISLCF